MQDFNDYKAQKQQADAYKLAQEIQSKEINENIALISKVGGVGGGSSQYEGHHCVMDVLNKIDSMVNMFERSIRENPGDKSAQKIVDVISALYDLAQSKMVESKKQCVSYMKKASGAPAKSASTPSTPSSTPAVSSEPGPDDVDVDFAPEPTGEE